MDMSIASMRRSLIVSHRQTVKDFPDRKRHPRLLGCSGDPRLQGGMLVSLARHSDDVHVTAEICPDDRLNRLAKSHTLVTIVFHNVFELDTVHPEGMVFSSLLHWSAPAGLGRYEFENWCQPGGDWDPYVAASSLIIVAESYVVYDRLAQTRA